MEPKPEEIAAGYIWLMKFVYKNPCMLEENRENDLIQLLKCKTKHIDTMKAREMICRFKEGRASQK
jgi:hypothetical protein